MTSADNQCFISDALGVEKVGNAFRFMVVMVSFSGGLFFGQAAMAVGMLLQ